LDAVVNCCCKQNLQRTLLKNLLSIVERDNRCAHV
jgi:hypothetical protein